MDVSLSKLWETVKDSEAWHAVCSPWGHKELDTAEWLDWTENVILYWANLSASICYHL